MGFWKRFWSRCRITILDRVWTNPKQDQLSSGIILSYCYYPYSIYSGRSIDANLFKCIEINWETARYGDWEILGKSRAFVFFKRRHFKGCCWCVAGFGEQQQLGTTMWFGCCLVQVSRMRHRVKYYSIDSCPFSSRWHKSLHMFWLRNLLAFLPCFNMFQLDTFPVLVQIFLTSDTVHRQIVLTSSALSTCGAVISGTSVLRSCGFDNAFVMSSRLGSQWIPSMGSSFCLPPVGFPRCWDKPL